jgi:hypothetical protein
VALDGMVTYLISLARARGVGSRGAWNVHAGSFYLRSASLRAVGSWASDGSRLSESNR